MTFKLWLYDDADDEAEGLWFELWIEPLYVSDPKQEPLLTLRSSPMISWTSAAHQSSSSRSERHYVGST